MKYNLELKKEIYRKRCEGYGVAFLSEKYGLAKSKIQYLCSLVDKHGLEVLGHKYTNYSPEYKLSAINRVLVNGENINAVFLEFGLTNRSILDKWIKSYIENGYNVVTKKKD